MSSRPEFRFSPRALVVVEIVLVVAVAAAIRFAPWARVFTPDGVRFAWDTDPNYHVLQAERFLREGASVLWFDPQLSWPEGAIVLWPPLFDVLIGMAAAVVAGPAAQRDAIERVAVVLPPVLGVLTILLFIGLGRALVRRDRAIGGALLLAVLPAHVLSSALGSADQHVAEVLLSCTVLLSFVLSWQSPQTASRRVWAAVGGLAVAASFWNWMGSAVTLVVPLSFSAAVHVFTPQRDVRLRVNESLAILLGVAAAVLAVTTVAFGAPDALSQGRISGVTGLHVAIAAGGAGFAAILIALDRVRGEGTGAPYRIVQVLLALGVPAVLAIVAMPPLRDGIAHGLGAAAASAWHGEIEEYRPLLLSCKYRLIDDLRIFVGTYGLLIPASLLAIPWLVSRWRAGDGEHRSVLFLAAWSIPFLVLGLLRRRFAPYMAIPLALVAWGGIRFWADALQARLSRWPGTAWTATVVGFLAVTAPTADVLPRAFKEGIPAVPEDDLRTMRWLAQQPSTPGREGVLATWDLGHLVRYYANRPVVVSPFGTDVGARAMQDAARFNLAADPSAAMEMLATRRVGFVVLTDPFVNAILDQRLIGAPPYVVRECSASMGRTFAVGSAYEDLLAPRLFYLDGLAQPGSRVPPIDRLRLAFEGSGARIKIFQVVAGAELRVEGARPLDTVQATIRLLTNQRREMMWSTSAAANAAGEAVLRVPYAAGANGAVFGSPYVVEDGASAVTADVSESDVVSGGARTVRLRTDEAAASGARSR